MITSTVLIQYMYYTRIDAGDVFAVCFPCKETLVGTRFSLSVENEQADAGRDGRTRLARPNSQARTGTGKYSFFPVQLTTSRIGNLTRLIYTLLYVMTIHTYMHTVHPFILYSSIR